MTRWMVLVLSLALALAVGTTVAPRQATAQATCSYNGAISTYCQPTRCTYNGAISTYCQPTRCTYNGAISTYCQSAPCSYNSLIAGPCFRYSKCSYNRALIDWPCEQWLYETVALQNDGTPTIQPGQPPEKAADDRATQSDQTTAGRAITFDGVAVAFQPSGAAGFENAPAPVSTSSGFGAQSELAHTGTQASFAGYLGSFLLGLGALSMGIRNSLMDDA